MKIWTTEEEAAKLKARFEGVNRAAFAREYGIKGGQASVYQHINGIRPISLDAAKAYAQGFKVSLAEISPRLAKEVADASAFAGEGDQSTGHAAETGWPFSVRRSEYDRLSPSDKAILDQTVSRYVAGCLAGRKFTFEMPPAASDVSSPARRRARR